MVTLRRAITALGCGIVISSAGAGLARGDEARLISLGKRLAPECTSCHKLEGAPENIPPITGWAKKEFIVTMGFYKSAERKHQVMNSVAQSLDDEQLEALAAYFNSLPRPPRKGTSPPAK